MAELANARLKLEGGPGASLDRIAAQHCISPRVVQMLFDEDGTTFSEFAFEQRLDAARSMLTSPRYEAWSVTAIALEAGFGVGSLEHLTDKQLEDIVKGKVVFQ